MPRRKATEQEEEVEVKVVKKQTKATSWFNDYAANNKSDLKIVCDNTAESVKEQFEIFVNSGNSEVYGVIFYSTFMTILEFIRKKQKTYNEFTIEIFNSINIGYTNNNDESNEKVGNFMPIMEYIGVNRVLYERNADENETLKAQSSREVDPDKTARNAMSWKSLNNKKSTDNINEIQALADKDLKEKYKLHLRTPEAIIPIFCTFMDHLTGYMKVKFKEAEGTDVSEVSMNVFGLFDIYYSFNADDNQEIIEFQPNITMKLALKSDELADRG